MGGRDQAQQGHASLGGWDMFHAAVRMTRMPMCLADPHQPDTPLVFVNDAFCEMTGYSREELLGRNCRFLQGELTDREDVRRMRRALDAHQDIAVEIYNYRKDGTGFWNALYLSPVFDEEGRLLFFFSSQLDVTRRKQAEMVLQQAQRMEALGSMAGGVAHEFNNLLTVVLANLEPMERGADERTLRRLARATDAVRRAARLTQQMLSFARRQYLEAHEIDLRTVLTDLDALIAQAAGSGVRVRLDLPEQPVPVRLDVGQLEIALLHLVRNARAAMSVGGELRIALSKTDAEEVRIVVSDTGIGMPPEVAARAAEPFFTTRGPGGGVGLGLSVVSGFVEQSGGSMQIDTAPGAGARVQLQFPGIRPAGA